MKYTSICLFCPTGYTFTFRDIDLLIDNESTIIFNYIAMSDGKKKIATFYKDTLVGASLCSE
jgi:hypothetical protein